MLGADLSEYGVKARRTLDFRLSSLVEKQLPMSVWFNLPMLPPSVALGAALGIMVRIQCERMVGDG